MTFTLPRRRLLHLGTGLAAAGLGLAGRPAHACEFFSPTLRVTHPWARATADDATSAVVCMRFDEVQQDDRLIGVETLLATGAEIGGPGAHAQDSPGIDIAIAKGSELLLSEHGTHIRLTGLTQPLMVGRSYPLRLLFAVGGALRADLSVDFARFR